ncbi:MAG: hypothetical protein LBG93_01875 [Treponema sp.]|nr:hypothetical protein [Treponema sp.]
MCWHCITPITDSEPLGRDKVCPKCGKDLRSCKNCRHLRPSGCAESSAEKPRDLERSNFCDWFSLNRTQAGAGGAQNNSAGNSKAAEEAKSAFEDLFKSP